MSIKDLSINNKNIKKMLIDNKIIYEKEKEEPKYDYYISTTGSNDNDGKTLQTAFADLTPLADIVENGDTVYVESGTYNITKTTLIDKGIKIESDKDNPAILDLRGNNFWLLNFDLKNQAEQTVELNNLYFTSTLTSGNRYLVVCNLAKGINQLKVDNCLFNNAYREWSGAALCIGTEHADNYAVVTNSSFTNNNGYSYGHLAAALNVNGHYGKLRVYHCIFNNPTGNTMYFGGTKGRAIGGCAGNDTVYLDLKGKCNQFLGPGDTCVNYTEEPCDE